MLSGNMTLKYVALLTLALHLLTAGDAFSVEKRSAISYQRQCAQKRHDSEVTSVMTSYHVSKPYATAAASGIVAMMGLLQPGIAMATTEVELAELPPPWIPVVFGIGLIVV